MILILIAVWMGFLWLLVKVGVLKKWHMWMKISPIAVWVIAMLVVFLPLNWTAPVGPVSVVVPSVPIRTAVSGPITDVSVISWAPLKQGDALFEIDPEQYAAKVKQAEAQLKLVEDQLQVKRKLLERNTVAEVEVDTLEAEFEAAKAQLSIARVDLEDTIVRAPIDGIVPAVTLLPGNRVQAGNEVMTILNVDAPIVAMIVKQNGMRYIRPGQPAEVVFRSMPGRAFSATVRKLFPSAPHAEYAGSGKTPEVPIVMDTTYAVELEVDLQGSTIAPGTSGQATILTEKVGGLGVIRRITLRMTTWLNFF